MFAPCTNVVSEPRKAGDGRTDPTVVAWLAAKEVSTFFVSAITLVELEIGMRRLERRGQGHGILSGAWLEYRFCANSTAASWPSTPWRQFNAPDCTCLIPVRTSIP